MLERFELFEGLEKFEVCDEFCAGVGRALSDALEGSSHVPDADRAGRPLGVSIETESLDKWAITLNSGYSSISRFLELFFHYCFFFFYSCMLYL